MPETGGRNTPPRWTLQAGKNMLSAVVDAAAKGVPQIVTRRGIETAVVVSYDEYERLCAASRRPTRSLAEYLLAMPSGPEGEEPIERTEVDDRFSTE